MRLFHIPLGLLSISVAFCFFSCVQEQEVPVVPTPAPVVFERLEGDLRFYTIPTSETSLSFEFDRLDDYRLKQVFLMQGSDTLSTAIFTDSEFVGDARKRVDFDYEFDSDEDYYFLVEVTDFSTPNTRFTYKLPDYKHVFASSFTINAFAEFDLMEDYDFSPSKDFIFVSNLINNEYFIHRIDLSNFSSITYFSESEIQGSLIRAISDKEFLFTGILNESYDSNQPDSALLRKNNIETKESEIIGSFSRSQGRVSKLIDDFIVVNKYSPNNFILEAINVKTGETNQIGEFQAPIRDDLFDRLIIGSYKYEIVPNDLKLIELDWDLSFGHLVYIDQNGFEFYINTDSEAPYDDRTPYYGLTVAKDGIKLYETDQASKGYLRRFQKFNVADDKFVYFKTFGGSNNYKIEGFYEVDLSTGTEKLIHADFHPFSAAVFDFGEKGIYMQRGGTFSLMTKN